MRKKECFEQLSDYELFIPNEQYFTDPLIIGQELDEEQFEEIYAQACQNYRNMLREMKEKWKYQSLRSFKVVGKLKNRFLPSGYEVSSNILLLATDISDDTPSYLLNPDSDLVRNLSRDEFFSVFIKFDEETREEAKREMEQYGSFAEIDYKTH